MAWEKVKDILRPDMEKVFMGEMKVDESKCNKWLKYLLITLGAGYAHPSNEERKNRAIRKIASDLAEEVYLRIREGF